MNLSIIHLLLFSFSLCADTMRFAFTIFRHGARSAYNEMTPDFKDWFGYQWSGVKELTAVGLRQHYLLGYRSRYYYSEVHDLFPKAPYKFDPREILVMSTDSNRTLLSANAQIQGLFQAGKGPTLTKAQVKNAVPPNDESTYKEEKEALGNDALPNKMFVLPVHTFFTRDHYIQLQDKKVCPGVEEIYKKNEQREVVKTFLKELSDKYGAQLSELTGQSNSTFLMNYTRAYSVLDAIIAIYTDGRDMTKFTDKGIDVQDLLNYCFKFFELDFVGNGEGHDEIGLIAMSPIFRQVLNWMDNKIQHDIKGEFDYIGYDTPKYVMYSAHDSTVGAFESFIKAVFGKNIIYAKFAANGQLELLRDPKTQGLSEDDFKVQYVFNDEVIFTMPYKEFKSTVEGKLKTAEQIADFCKFPATSKGTNYNAYMIVTIVLGVIALILIGIVVHIFMNKPPTHNLIPTDDKV